MQAAVWGRNQRSHRQASSSHYLEVVGMSGQSPTQQAELVQRATRLALTRSGRPWRGGWWGDQRQLKGAIHSLRVAPAACRRKPNPSVAAAVLAGSELYLDARW